MYFAVYVWAGYNWLLFTGITYGLIQSLNLHKPGAVSNIENEPAHDKTYNKTCVTSKDSDLPVHPPSVTKVLVYPSLNCLEAVEGTYDQRRLRSACAYAQADRSLRWAHMSFCLFCHERTQMFNSSFPTDRSKTVPLVQFFFVCL